MNILVLGVTGMLGSAVFSSLVVDPRFRVFGTLRSPSGMQLFAEPLRDKLVGNVDVLDHDSLVTTFDRARPDIVINCVGLIKQLAVAKDPLQALPVNSMLPHRLARLCGVAGARLIHISTDCVFSGRAGMYKEGDPSDAEDLYGKSKHIGELHDVEHAITLRTSIIGHGVTPNSSLVDWFLGQTDSVMGFQKAVFSGLPTVELACVIRDYVIPAPELHGLYHVSAGPIDKYSLLQLVAQAYGKKIDIVPDEQLHINRSLDSSRFQQATGYQPPEWRQLVQIMHDAH